MFIIDDFHVLPTVEHCMEYGTLSDTPKVSKLGVREKGRLKMSRKVFQSAKTLCQESYRAVVVIANSRVSNLELMYS